VIEAPFPVRYQPAQASILQSLVRSVTWAGGFLRLGVTLLFARLRGIPMALSLGPALRRLFETMGATGIKLGQQLSMRVDMLPYTVCESLSQLVDQVPPFSVEQATEEIERGLGRPLTEVFQRLDPHPIGSASIAVVYLAERLDGRRVAVKVKRPGVDLAFTADLRALDWMTRMLEWTTVVRPGFYRYLRSEVRTMFQEELDFVQEARYQRLFRRMARKSGPSWLSAPEVHSDLSCENVIVSDCIDAVPLTHILRMIDANDREGLARLRDRNIDPRVLARRLFYLGTWAQHEALFFHADPHPGNILVAPGNKFVMLDFGACGTFNQQDARTTRRFFERIRTEKPSRAADVVLVQSGPFPPMATSELRETAQHAFSGWFRAGRDPHAAWWERTTATVWLAFVESSKKHGLSTNLDTLRRLRCSLLYDTTMVRLDPQIPTGLFTRYRRQAEKRLVKRARRQRDKPEARADRRWANLETALERFEKATEALQQRAAQRRIPSRQVVGELPAGVGLLLTSSAAITGVFASWWLARSTWRITHGLMREDLFVSLEHALANPGMVLVLLGFAWAFARRIHWELEATTGKTR
jgi:ubiquinone biosynthesis protein